MTYILYTFTHLKSWNCDTVILRHVWQQASHSLATWKLINLICDNNPHYVAAEFIASWSCVSILASAAYTNP